MGGYSAHEEAIADYMEKNIRAPKKWRWCWDGWQITKIKRINHKAVCSVMILKLPKMLPLPTPTNGSSRSLEMTQTSSENNQQQPANNQQPITVEERARQLAHMKALLSGLDEVAEKHLVPHKPNRTATSRAGSRANRSQRRSGATRKKPHKTKPMLMQR